MKITALIPVRLDSTRLPGKALADLEGKPVIQRVWEAVCNVPFLDSVIVATDSPEIAEKVISFGGTVQMTSSKHCSGTDRVAEVASSLDSDVIVNVQGDEPFVNCEMIETLVSPFKEDNSVIMTTLKAELTDEKELLNPNVVKVITDVNDNAIYFSRQAIPYVREKKYLPAYYKHLGLYGYKRSFLIDFANMKATPLERAESLEQLRALENGFTIKVGTSRYNSFGIDTAEQLEAARQMIKEGKQ